MPIQIDPNIDWKAQGAYGGALAGLQSAQVQREQEQNLEQSRLANLYQGLQNDRYAQMTPSEVQRSQGLGMQEQAKGRVLDETAQAQIDEQLSKYAAGKSQGELQKDLIGIQSQLVQLQQAKNAYMNAHPGQKLQIAQQLATQAGIDPNSPQFQQIMQYGPDKFLDTTINTYETILARAPDVLGKLQTIDRSGEWDLKKAQIMADAAKYGADTRAQAANKPQKFNEAEYLAQLDQVIAGEGSYSDEGAVAEAKALRDAYIARKQAINPMMQKQGTDIGAVTGLPTTTAAEEYKKRQVQSTQPSGGLEAAIKAELERRAKQGK